MSNEPKMTYKKKLIEVALPLEEINVASAKEKSIRHGHPSTLHLWWARRPLAACRAVLFASLVDDPSSDPAFADKGETEQEKERERLFKIIRELVLWENSNNKEVLARARAEIMRCTDNNPPPVLDPFCGGGSIPLEAQRLGLETYGSDLNPVAVLITKALIEIPPKFAGRPPVNSVASAKIGGRTNWPGATGLAADVRFYGDWMCKEAEKRIGHLYPKAKLPKELGSGEAIVIAWLWARAVTCPNPACGAQMPLVRSFWLSSKKGKEAWVEPIVDSATGQVGFKVLVGSQGNADVIGAGTGFVDERGKKVQATFLCPKCHSGVAKGDYIDSEANAGRIGSVPLAVVMEAKRGRVYATFGDDETAALESGLEPFGADPDFQSKLPLEECRGTFASNAQGRRYGFHTFKDYFTPRQLVALSTFSDLVGEARTRIRVDAVVAGLLDDDTPLHTGGLGATAYADAVATYLATVASKAAVFHNTTARWRPGEGKSAPAFGRQGIPMVWDFAEVNPFAGAGGDFSGVIDGAVKVLGSLPARPYGRADQLDATQARNLIERPIICTDPPYYDNIGYADLSDFFYVWLRRSAYALYPDLFGTMLTPKSEELIASPYRFNGSRDEARHFFETGLGHAFAQMHRDHNPGYPLTVFYAFKQSEADDGDDGQEAATTASTGWETMLEGLLRAGFAVTGTWPGRTEGATRLIAMGTNSLASSIILVCRPRQIDAEVASRRDFVNALRRELPDALILLQHGNIAPVDLAQAAIGPGMAVFSRYSQVLEADGSPMRVRTALQLINQELDAYLEAQEGELDSDTRFCIAWFDQYAHRPAPFGVADVLARAKGTAVDSLARAGVLASKEGKVHLLRRDELPEDWDPRTDRRLTVWECAQHLIRRLETEGEDGAARLQSDFAGDLSERARALAYRLYALCERKKWAEEALAYNSIVVSWPAIQEKAADQRSSAATTFVQQGLT